MPPDLISATLAVTEQMVHLSHSLQQTCRWQDFRELIHLSSRCRCALRREDSDDLRVVLGKIQQFSATLVI